MSHVSSHDKASAWKRHKPPNRQNDSTYKPDFVSVHPRTAQRAQNIVASVTEKEAEDVYNSEVSYLPRAFQVAQW